MSRDRAYTITLNNYTKDELEQIDELCRNATYGIYGKEKAKTGTPHLQGYIYYSNKISYNTLCRILPRAHFEHAKGNASQNQTYCSKEGDFTEYGRKPSQGKRMDFENFRDNIYRGDSLEELLMDFPEMMAKYPKFYQMCRNVLLKHEAQKKIQPIVTVITGEPGIGKTKYVYDNHNHEDIYKVEIGDGSANSIFWDGYDGESVILIDDFHNNFKLDYMLRLLDRYPLKLNTKGNFTWKCSKYVYITSNIPVDNWYSNCPEIHRKALKRRITNQLVLQDQRT
nr:rep protein [Cressdnaviricota sp.]